METIHLVSYKVIPAFNLDQIASLFQISRSPRWKEYLMLNDNHIDMVLKYKTQARQVYLFLFGCITFVNFTEEESGTFLEYLETITGSLDYRLYAKYHEEHRIIAFEDGTCRLWDNSQEVFPYTPGILPIMAVILAKSSALRKIEADVETLLDETEGLLTSLYRGQLPAKSAKFAPITAKILRFKYDVVKTIRIFDRSIYGEENQISREIYDSAANYYELFERFKILRSKVNNLLNITKAYMAHSYQRSENRLYWFEVLLLALFPLSRLLSFLLAANWH